METNRKMIIPSLLLSLIGIMSCSTEEPDREFQDNSVMKAQRIVNTMDINKAYSFENIESPDVWKTFNTLKDQQNACQIPETILQRMTTQALVETCMKYPLRGIYSAYNDEIKGLQVIINGFNGLIELKNRDDAPRQLINYYSKMIDSCASACKEGNNENAINTIDFDFIELLLSYPINEGLCSDDYSAELNRVFQKAYDFKVAHPDYFGTSSLMRGLRNKCNKNIKKVTPTSYIMVQTHNGYNVVGMILPELAPLAIAQRNVYYQHEYPNATFISTSTRTYNCHSYAWNMTDGGPTC